MYSYSSVVADDERGYVERFCDRVEQSLDQGLMPVEVFRDERLFRAEMERIFTRSWVFVAHETEIANPGDFVLRKVGLDKVIVTRSRNGQVNVLLNHCRHRGAELCFEDSGNATHFRCPYHGWTYKNDGDFVGAPNMSEAYGVRPDPKKWGLLRAPKVESIHGFVFACLSEEAPGLREYLGGAAWMFDAIFGLHPDGMRVLAPPERLVIKGDWKIGAEQFSGDSYHVSTTHYSTTASKFVEGDVREFIGKTRGFLFENGHSFLGHVLPEWLGPAYELWGYAPQFQKQFDLSRLDAAQVKMLKTVPPTIGTIFPNLSYNRFPQPASPGEPPIPFTNIRVWQPLEPGVMEMWNWELEWKFMPDANAQRAYKAAQFTFGSGGIFEQDDTAIWESVTKASSSPWNRKKQVQLHYQQRRIDPDPDWKGPGQFFPTTLGEYMQKAFWRRWVKDMREGHEEAVRS